jgi:hypothetical protein
VKSLHAFLGSNAAGLLSSRESPGADIPPVKVDVAVMVIVSQGRLGTMSLKHGAARTRAMLLNEAPEAETNSSPVFAEASSAVVAGFIPA